MGGYGDGFYNKYRYSPPEPRSSAARLPPVQQRERLLMDKTDNGGEALAEILYMNFWTASWKTRMIKDHLQ